MDHSQTLDFYEYLLVVDKIMKKTGTLYLYVIHTTMLSKTTNRLNLFFLGKPILNFFIRVISLRLY